MVGLSYEKGGFSLWSDSNSTRCSLTGLYSAKCWSKTPLIFVVFLANLFGVAAKMNLVSDNRLSERSSYNAALSLAH